MNRSHCRLWWIGLLGLVWFVPTEEAPAWERPPVKINTKIEFQFDVKVGPDFRRPTAPWYAYFPVDPRMLPSPQTSPYPPWPASFPPPGPPGHPKEAQRPADRSAPRTAQVSQLWPNQGPYGTAVQPVGYVPAQAPSYWYRNP